MATLAVLAEMKGDEYRKLSRLTLASLLFDFSITGIIDPYLP